MIKVSFFKESNYPIDSAKIKDAVLKVIQRSGKFKNGSVSISVVGESEMEELNKKYYKDKVYVHPVFTFPEEKGSGFVFPPNEKHLGEIVISYEQSKQMAEEKNILIEEALSQLAEHAAWHLVGIHHN